MLFFVKFLFSLIISRGNKSQKMNINIRIIRKNYNNYVQFTHNTVKIYLKQLFNGKILAFQ